MTTPICIWATRPEAQNRKWAATLEAWAAKHGAQANCAVEACPLMAIQAVDDEDGQARIRSRLQDLDLYTLVIFVSQNAVAAFFEWCDAFWPQLPVGVRFVGVGQRTQAAIDHALVVMGGQVEPGLPTFDPNKPMTSAALLAEPFMQAVDGQRILICRGRGGLPLLGETLADRGAKVDYCELYDRSVPPAALQCAPTLLSTFDRHLIPVFSGESLAGLVTVLEKLDGTAHMYERITVVVPSERVLNAAEEAGFENAVCAVNATEPAMLTALETCL